MLKVKFNLYLYQKHSYLYIIIINLKIKIMYTEAFLFVGNLLQNGLIEKIKFGKTEFKVRFKGDKRFVPYEYSGDEIVTFLEDLENAEKRK